MCVCVRVNARMYVSVCASVFVRGGSVGWLRPVSAGKPPRQAAADEGEQAGERSPGPMQIKAGRPQC